MSGTVLIVDDSKRVYESLKPNFELLGYKTAHAFNMKTTIDTLKSFEPDVALVDIMLGDENGIDILRRIKQIDEMIPVIMITGYASIDTAVESMKEGAYDYIKKPLEFERLVTIIENAAKLRFLSRENRQLKSRVIELKPKIYAENEKMANLLAQARKLAAGDIPILILGENGSGKEIVADYIHEHSQRSEYKMHKINCAAFPETLLDNELFGHEKGAYTGATEGFKGVFERANKGILFLDEIGDMPLSIQAKILRVLQNNEVRRIGGTVTKKIDVRFLAATNQNLEQLIEEGKFREDLYYRLNAAIIETPPLRSRTEDIKPMAYFFLKEFTENMGKRVDTISDEVINLFLEYQWPGNVRELKNAINYGVTITSNNVIKLEDIPPKIIGNMTEPKEESDLNIRQKMEKMLIEKTLLENNFNKKRSAEILKMSRKTLYTKIERYDIQS